MHGHGHHPGIRMPEPSMAPPLTDYLETQGFQCPDYILRLQGRKSGHDSLDFYFMDPDEFRKVAIILFFQAQLDDFFDISHEFI